MNMKSQLLDKGRLRYIDLNKKFLEEVEKGTSWEALHPLVEEMKSLAIYLQHIPTTTEHFKVVKEEQQATGEAAEAET
jgi:hypothetical protein